MPKIELFPFQHKNATQIGISHPYDQEVNLHLKKLNDINWSHTHSCFYMLLTTENKKRLFFHLRKKGWYVDFEKIRFLPQKGDPKETKTDKERERILKEYTNYLKGKRYSESSVKTYSNFVFQFVKFQQKPITELNNRDIELFLEDKFADNKYSISTHRQCISALSHFFELHQRHDISIAQMKRPKKDKSLPKVLSEEEIIALLQATRNIKHRAILALLYSSGLRIGELLNLKLTYINVARRQIKIHRGKGRKDRYVVMAEAFLPLFYNYIATYKPTTYFVEGSAGGPYSSSSVRGFLKTSCQRAGINKRVTPHMLRHSYATHMLEHGVGLRHIQELLGHAKPETTMIYTHVAQKDLMQIKSPLDFAVKRAQALGKTDKKGENPRLSGDLLD